MNSKFIYKLSQFNFILNIQKLYQNLIVYLNTGGLLVWAILVGNVQSHVTHVVHRLRPLSPSKSDWHVAYHVVHDFRRYLLCNVPWSCNKSHSESWLIQKTIQRKGKCCSFQCKQYELIWHCIKITLNLFQLLIWLKLLLFYLAACFDFCIVLYGLSEEDLFYDGGTLHQFTIRLQGGKRQNFVHVSIVQTYMFQIS